MLRWVSEFCGESEYSAVNLWSLRQNFQVHRRIKGDCGEAPYVAVGLGNLRWNLLMLR